MGEVVAAPGAGEGGCAGAVLGGQLASRIRAPPRPGRRRPCGGPGRRRGQLVGHARIGDASSRPSRSAPPRSSRIGCRPATPDRDVDLATRATGGPKCRSTTTASRAPVEGLQPRRSARALASGSSGSSGRRPPGTLDASMPALAHTKPSWCARSAPGRVGDDSPRLSAPAPAGAASWSAAGEVDQRALGLGHDLLRDDHDVAIPQVDRRRDQRGQVVTPPNSGRPGTGSTVSGRHAPPAPARPWPRRRPPRRLHHGLRDRRRRDRGLRSPGRGGVDLVDQPAVQEVGVQPGHADARDLHADGRQAAGRPSRARRRRRRSATRRPRSRRSASRSPGRPGSCRSTPPGSRGTAAPCRQPAIASARPAPARGVAPPPAAPRPRPASRAPRPTSCWKCRSRPSAVSITRARPGRRSSAAA